MDKNSLNYWFPYLQKAHLPIPKTVLVPMPRPALRDVFNIFDGKQSSGSLERFGSTIEAAAISLGGYPCFLRTSHTSAKHDWKRTCYLADSKKIVSHVLSIVEYSELAQIIGLPCDWWAVREMLPTSPITICPGWGDMPVCKEFRVFVDDGKVRCWHPYWPPEALEDGGVSDAESVYLRLANCEGLDDMLELAEIAGRSISGSWSVDILSTERGWYVTDMATAKQSFHWRGCKFEHHYDDIGSTE